MAKQQETDALTDDERVAARDAWMLVVDQPLSVEGAGREPVSLEGTEETD